MYQAPPGEDITGVSVNSGDYIDSIEFKTNKGNKS